MNAVTPTPMTPEQKAALDKKWDSVDLDLVREGEKIILPANPHHMSIDAAIMTLKRMKQAEEQEYTINEKVECHFFDGLVAFAKALKQKYGFSQAVPTPGFWGPTPPSFVHVKTGPAVGDVVQVPVGSFKLPNIDGTLKTSYGLSRGVPCLVIGGVVKAKEKNIVMELVKLTSQIAKNESIYKGKSIELRRDESGGIDYNEQLEFLDVATNNATPIFDADTELLIDVALLGPIQKSAECRSHGIPLKRGVLLEGPYGTGKTLVARQVAKIANENGWTFISCTSAQALKYALQFARMHQPAVVFAEDMDRIAGNRNEGANDLINDIDGIVGKNDEIITVLTTNFASKIDKAFLRPGRLDAVVSLRAPEADAVDRLVREFAKETFPADQKLTKAMPLLKGNIPAVIREIVERSKLAMIYNGNKTITDDDIYIAAFGMKNHLQLIEDAAEGKRDDDGVGVAVGKVVSKVIGDKLKEVLS